MGITEAQQKCPDLVLVSGEDLTPYRHASCTPACGTLTYNACFSSKICLCHHLAMQRLRNEAFAGKQASAYCPSCSDLVFASVVAWTRCWWMSLLRWNAELHRVLCRPCGPPTYTATRYNITSLECVDTASLTPSTCSPAAAVRQTMLRTLSHASSAPYSSSYTLDHAT